MWIPTPIYERIPQFWLLIGLLFITAGTYLGFDYTLSFVYFGVGFFCCFWSMCVFTLRLRHRKPPEELVQQAKIADDLKRAEKRQSDQDAEPVI